MGPGQMNGVPSWVPRLDAIPTRGLAAADISGHRCRLSPCGRLLHVRCVVYGTSVQAAILRVTDCESLDAVQGWLYHVYRDIESQFGERSSPDFRRVRRSFHTSVLQCISGFHGITDWKDQDLLLRVLELDGPDAFVIFYTSIYTMLGKLLNAAEVIRFHFTSKGDVVFFLFPTNGRIGNVIRIIAVPDIDKGLVLTGNGEPYQIATICYFTEFGHPQDHTLVREYFENAEDWRWISVK